MMNTYNRKQYQEQYRSILKEKSKYDCPCGVSYHTHNSKVHINRHNNSRVHLKYMFDNGLCSLEDYLPKMTLVEVRAIAKKYDIKDYLYFEKNYLIDGILTFILIENLSKK